ncbi:hypothetical protein [Staphylococcus agnetis]|uniref:Uncharacterized protein n=1 Tax=Staphylococcus agnetis TaxID=985762 RepID=A0ABX3Z0W1_9STAP|nr:hypothetical protein [Staphylococcus agnetis]MDG4943911.1 hypothetical protein [Staphylococcus agnetis]OSP22564.1 hypothetical protein B9L42_00360 [Staphylococcus agnetis]OSP23145.1 hypothetical protein B9M87_09435 [Staphylococcus agnetis]OTW30542.1 hypothetical protein B9M88_09745 [Staphylococcus agnetis]
MKKVLFSKSFLVALSLVIAFFSVFSAPVSAKTSDDHLKIIQESLKYNVQTEKYVFNSDLAKKKGLNDKQAANLKNFFESMNSKEIKAFNKEIGFAPDLKSLENSKNPQIAPVLAGIIGAIGGALAAKLMDEIMNYGIAKTCQKNKGKNAAFDDYCKTNGHI